MDERDTTEPQRAHSTTPPIEFGEAAATMQQAPARPRIGLPLFAASIAAAIAVGVGIGYAAFHNAPAKTTPTAAIASVTSAGTFPLTGTFTLQRGAFINEAPTCQGYTGYTDIAAGTPVTVADQTGQTIAVGHLDTGAVQGGAERATACQFTFRIDVPDGKPFYQVTVSHRGTQNYTATQAKQGIALTLGG